MMVEKVSPSVPSESAGAPPARTQQITDHVPTQCRIVLGNWSAPGNQVAPSRYRVTLRNASLAPVVGALMYEARMLTSNCTSARSNTQCMSVRPHKNDTLWSRRPSETVWRPSLLCALALQESVSGFVPVKPS